MPSSVATRRTVEVYLPDQEFDFYCKVFSDKASQPHPHPRRRQTEPHQPLKSMARDSIAGRSTNYHQALPAGSSYSRRSSGNTITQYSTTYNNTCTSIAQSRSNATSYAPTNITGFRRTLDVPGMPTEDYFTTGRSKLDRRVEYIRPPLPPNGSAYSARTRSYHGGQEMVRYTGSRSSVEEPREVSDDDDDDITVMPCDSISQVSSRRSSGPRLTERRRLYGEQPVREIGWGRSNSYAEGMSRYGGGGSGYRHVRAPTRVVERRPGGY